MRILSTICLATLALGRASAAAEPPLAAVAGGIVRWTAPATQACGVNGRTWRPLGETCYYAIDLEQKPGRLEVRRRGARGWERAIVGVDARPSARQDIALGDIPQANPLPADDRRNAREQQRLAALWRRREGPARFTLPLGAPARKSVPGEGFGSTWVFDGPRGGSELHTGADYALPAGTPVTAVADGTVVMAEELFYSGNSVFVDHGDGLVSMCFHLSQIDVKAGQQVRKGDVVGLVGRTGRVSGAHLHVGFRWHGARVDPEALFEDPVRIPAVNP